MEANAFVALNTGVPTFLSNATGSTSHLDLAIASAPLARKGTWTVIDDSMGIDHSPILIAIEEAVSVEESFVPKWLHRKADWMAFKADCRQGLTVELVTDDIEVSHSNIIGSLMEVASRTFPGLSLLMIKPGACRSGPTSANATSGRTYLSPRAVAEDTVFGRC